MPQASLFARGSSPRPICVRWNRYGCTAPQCTFRHVCLECHQPHKAAQCSQQLATLRTLERASAAAIPVSPLETSANHVSFQAPFVRKGIRKSSHPPSRPSDAQHAELAHNPSRCTTTSVRQTNAPISTHATITHSDNPPICMSHTDLHSRQSETDQATMYPSLSPLHNCSVPATSQFVDQVLYNTLPPPPPPPPLQAHPPFSPPTVFTLAQGRYPYTSHLLALDQRCSTAPIPPIPGIKVITSPLGLASWSWALKEHPDSDFVTYILKGLHEGFRIGASPELTITSSSRNMPSALENPGPVTDYLTTKGESRRIIGPLPIELAHQHHIHISRFGVIP